MFRRSFKSGLFVTARTRSSRLPRKMLLDLGGRSVLGFLLERTSSARIPGPRVLCTSDHPEDGKLARVARDHGWLVFRGDGTDVLERYAAACSRYDIDFFVNLDGDDSFCCPRHVDLILQRFHETRADYIYCEGLPLGTAPIGVKAEALADVCARKTEADTQGWGKYFTGSGLYRVERIQAPPECNRPGYRLTLDYPQDLDLFRALISGMGRENPWHVSLEDLIRFLDEHPEIAAINQGVAERYWIRFQEAHGSFDRDAFEEDRKRT